MCCKFTDNSGIYPKSTRYKRDFSEYFSNFSISKSKILNFENVTFVPGVESESSGYSSTVKLHNYEERKVCILRYYFYRLCVKNTWSTEPRMLFVVVKVV